MLSSFLTSAWGLTLTVAGVIVVLGGAITYLVKTGRAGLDWFRPKSPLVTFGHPSEDGVPFVFWLGGSPEEDARQEREAERIRLSTLSVSYLVENKDDVPVRELTTGVRSRDSGREVTAEECFVQVLRSGESVDVPHVEVPAEIFEGMTDTDRAVNFVYWARYLDPKGRRWEAVYDPRTRVPEYRLLTRRAKRRPARAGLLRGSGVTSA